MFLQVTIVRPFFVFFIISNVIWYCNNLCDCADVIKWWSLLICSLDLRWRGLTALTRTWMVFGSSNLPIQLTVLLLVTLFLKVSFVCMFFISLSLPSLLFLSFFDTNRYPGTFPSWSLSFWNWPELQVSFIFLYFIHLYNSILEFDINLISLKYNLLIGIQISVVQINIQQANWIHFRKDPHPLRVSGLASICVGQPTTYPLSLYLPLSLALLPFLLIYIFIIFVIFSLIIFRNWKSHGRIRQVLIRHHLRPHRLQQRAYRVRLWPFWYPTKSSNNI